MTADREQVRRDAELLRAEGGVWWYVADRYTSLLAELEQAEQQLEKNSNPNLVVSRNHWRDRALEAERERNDARAGVTDFISEDEDVGDKTLAEWFAYMRDWGDQGWWHAGKAEARLASVPALVEALRHIAHFVYDVNSNAEADCRSLKDLAYAALTVYEQSQGNG